jgi:hypothetical protein
VRSASEVVFVVDETSAQASLRPANATSYDSSAKG